MNERVRPDYSIGMGVSGSDETFLLDPRYDFIRVFPWLGYGIVNILTENGVARLYTTEEQCRQTHESSGIPLVELEWISESEHESMRGIIANSIDDSWLD